MKSAKATFRASAVGATIGAAMLGYSVLGGSDDGETLGATLLIVSAMVMSVMVVLERLTDTSAERAALRVEHDTYIAAQVALASERDMVRKDLANGARRLTEQLTRERAAMRQRFNEDMFKVQRRAFETGFLMAQNGDVMPEDVPGATVLHLPRRPSEPVTQQTGLN